MNRLYLSIQWLNQLNNNKLCSMRYTRKTLNISNKNVFQLEPSNMYTFLVYFIMITPTQKYFPWLSFEYCSASVLLKRIMIRPLVFESQLFWMIYERFTHLYSIHFSNYSSSSYDHSNTNYFRIRCLQGHTWNNPAIYETGSIGLKKINKKLLPKSILDRSLYIPGSILG